MVTKNKKIIIDDEKEFVIQRTAFERLCSHREDLIFEYKELIKENLTSFLNSNNKLDKKNDKKLEDITANILYVFLIEHFMDEELDKIIRLYLKQRSKK